MASLIAALAEADWLDGARARAYAAMLAIGLALLTGWFLLVPGAAPLAGGDFISFYAASKLALAGHGADAWRPDLHQAAELALVPGFTGYFAFLYPPPYLLVCLPLALLPLKPALLAWAVATAALAGLGLSGFLRAMGTKEKAWLVLALPALWVDAMNGQNGALTLALLAGGFGLLDRRPLIAGVLLGGLVVKPQLAPAVPFILLAAGRWPVLVAAAATALALSLAAFGLVGPDGYAAFLANSVNARAALEQGAVQPALMQSVFAALRLWGAPPASAYLAQLATAGLALGFACGGARKACFDAPALGALAAAAGALVSPFLLDYDLTMTALPLAWLIRHGAARGFRRGEKLLIVVVLVLPVFGRALALDTRIQLMPAVLALLFVAVLTRAAAMPAAAGAGTAPGRR